MSIFIEDSDFKLFHGDALSVLKTMSDESIDCCVSSPPYWNLRDYQTGSWDGGDLECDHSVGGQVQDTKAPGAIQSGIRPGVDAGTCRNCGALRIDKQIGLEQSPEEFVQNLVEIFREVKRVLVETGTCWINLGSSYCSASGGKIEGWKPKDLIPIPWMVGLALQKDGWWLRLDVIWDKVNGLPEAVKDRPTKSHEYILFLTKSDRYYFGQEDVREPHTSTRWGGPIITQPPDTKYAEATANGFAGAAEALSREGRQWNAYPEGGRNIRSVWRMPTGSYGEEHYAAFPDDLARRAILAGCPDGGTVLDCFGGSGTTALIARNHGRRSVLIELSESYCRLAAKRLQQLSLFSEIS